MSNYYNIVIVCVYLNFVTRYKYNKYESFFHFYIIHIHILIYKTIQTNQFIK